MSLLIYFQKCWYKKKNVLQSCSCKPGWVFNRLYVRFHVNFIGFPRGLLKPLPLLHLPTIRGGGGGVRGEGGGGGEVAVEKEGEERNVMDDVLITVLQVC